MQFKQQRQVFWMVVGLIFLPTEARLAPLKLCYLSLNQESEREELLRELRSGRSASLPSTAPGVQVAEFFQYGDRAHAAFRAMLEKSVACDGLVLSGHHRAGGFEGSRATGRLAIENLERWSCAPRFRTWFASVRALWLQGCATSKRGTDDQSELSHRYARIFPNATIFAWSGSAPSRMGAVTIPLQLKNLAKLQEGAVALAPEQALSSLLAGESAAAAVQAWEGLQQGKGDKVHGIANRTARGFLPLALSQEFSQEPDYCVLENSSDAAHRFATVKQILVTPTVSDLRKVEREWERSADYPQYRSALAKLLNSNKTGIGSPLEVLAKSNSVGAAILRYRLHLVAGGSVFPVWENRLQNALVQQLKHRHRGFDEVERKHHYGQLAAAALAPLPDGRVLLASGPLRVLKNRDALLALLRAMIEFRSPQQVPHLFALAENPALPFEAVPILESLVQTSDTSTKKIYYQKRYGVRTKLAAAKTNVE